MVSLSTIVLLTLSDGLSFTQRYYSYEDIYALNKEESEASLRVTINRLKKQGYIEQIQKNTIVHFRLASKGRQKLIDLFLPKANRRWDGKWRIVITRKTIKLAKLNRAFVSIQKRVYVSPFLVKETIPGSVQFETRTIAAMLPGAFADKAFRLTQLANRYNAWIARVAGMGRKEKEATTLIREYQEILGNDPFLPTSLLPRPWPAASAASVFQALLKRRFEQRQTSRKSS